MRACGDGEGAAAGRWWLQQRQELRRRWMRWAGARIVLPYGGHLLPRRADQLQRIGFQGNLAQRAVPAPHDEAGHARAALSRRQAGAAERACFEGSRSRGEGFGMHNPACVARRVRGAP